MNTELLSASNTHDIDRAGELLLAGELVAVPTETVYGLAADATNPEAVAKIFAAKNRPTNHPLITHIHSVDVLSNWACHIPEWVYGLVDKCWPGPLTLILEKQPEVNDIITGGLPTIGLRMPNHPVLRELLSSHQLAVAAPSANPYQRLSPTTAEQVMDGLQGKIAAVLDGGPCQIGTESTILAVYDGKARLLRSGPLSLNDIQPYVPMTIECPEAHQEAVSGNKEIHYQPYTAVYLKTTATILSQEIPESVALLTYSKALKNIPANRVIHLDESVAAYRKGLYASLFALDKMHVKEIWVELPPEQDGWLDIRDRLSKAGSF